MQKYGVLKSLYTLRVLRGTTKRGIETSFRVHIVNLIFAYNVRRKLKAFENEERPGVFCSLRNLCHLI